MYGPERNDCAASRRRKTMIALVLTVSQGFMLVSDLVIAFIDEITG